MALLTAEGVYKDGKVELAETPMGVGEETRVLVTFLPANGAQTAKTEMKLHDSDASSDEVVARILADLEEGIDLGGPPYPKREDLYDRLQRR